MADKKLLEESTIRRFMKLANIDGKSSGLLSESKHGGGGAGLAVKGGNNYKASKVQQEAEEVEEEGKNYEEEAHNYEEGLEEADGMDDMDDMDDMDEPDAEGDLDSDVGGDNDAAVKTQLEAIANAANELAKLAGGSASMQTSGGSDDMGGEPDMGAAPMAERKFKGMKDEARHGKMKDEGKDPEVEEEGVEEEGELEESINVVDDDLVERLVQRVSARLVREAKAAKQKKLNESEFGSHKNGGYKTHPVGKATPFKGSTKILGLKGKHQVKKKKHSSK